MAPKTFFTAFRVGIGIGFVLGHLACSRFAPQPNKQVAPLATAGSSVAGEDDLGSLASAVCPLANPEPGYSLVGDRGVVASTCADEGWDFVFSVPPNHKLTSDWDKEAVRSLRTPGVPLKFWGGTLCGYGYEPFFSGSDNHIMLDIGANIGQTLFNYYARGWRVVAFEPVPENVNTIRRNIFINGVGSDRIALVNGVASNHSGAIEIYTPKGWSDSTSVSQEGVAAWKGIDIHKVSAIEVDEYIDAAKSPHFRNKIMFVKIDTQGHELSVLQGMKKFLSDPPSTEDLGGWSFIVKAEYDADLQKKSGHGPNDMLDFMWGLGYEVRCEITDDKPIEKPNLPKCADVYFSKGKPVKPSA